MKNIGLSALMVCISILAYAQQANNKWSVGLEGGMHGVISKTTTGYKSPNFNYYGVNVRYMANSNFGFMTQLGYNGFDFSKGNDQYERVNYLNFTLEGVANLSNIMNFSSWSKHIGLLLHAGPGGGFSGFNSDDYKVDKVLVGRLGISPIFKLGERVTLTTDLTFNGHLKQNRTFDRFNDVKISGRGVDSYFFTSSVGLTFNLGKNAKHSDWAGADDFSDYERRIAELEAALADDDKDGVSNAFDKDNETPAGLKVDAQGVAIADADGDGVLDAFDECPEAAGTFATNGCPDSDKDGVADKDDECPDVAGAIYSKGCMPSQVQTSEATKTVLKEATETIMFNLGSAEILAGSTSKIEAIVEVLKENPSYNLIIQGYTDDLGTSEYNMALSEKRAEAVKKVILNKGIKENRLVTKGYGEDFPAVQSAESREANRRVEFKIF